LKISTLNSRTFQTFPGSVRTLHNGATVSQIRLAPETEAIQLKHHFLLTAELFNYF